MSGPCPASIDACTTSFWAYQRLCNGLSPLVSVALPLVIPSQAVAMLGSVTRLRHPKCAHLWIYHRILACHHSALTPWCLGESLRQHRLGMYMPCRPGTQSFHQWAEQKEQPLDLKLINVTLILSFGRT